MALVNWCGVASNYLNGWLLEFTTALIIGLGCGVLLLYLVVALHWFKPSRQQRQSPRRPDYLKKRPTPVAGIGRRCGG
jgi:hypothetical protein